MAQSKAKLKALRKKFHLGEFFKKSQLSKRKTRGGSVVRHRRSRSRARGFGGFGGGGKLMNGLFPVKGILGNALIGAGAATLSEKIAPQVIPFQSYAIAFVVGGIPGVAGAFARDALKVSPTGIGISTTVTGY